MDRRLEQMSAEGVKFVTGAEVGKNVAMKICGPSSMPLFWPAVLNIHAISTCRGVN